jgi:hypothetical protein
VAFENRNAVAHDFMSPTTLLTHQTLLKISANLTGVAGFGPPADLPIPRAAEFCYIPFNPSDLMSPKNRRKQP